MGTQKSFRAVVEAVLNRYRQTSLATRWKEATLSEPELRPLAFWVRESDDLVNIVWLTPHDIRDITWYPDREMSTFSFARLSAITGLEVREVADAAKKLGLTVTGHYVVNVHTYSGGGGFVWVAGNEKEVTELQEFVGQSMKLLLES